MSQNPELEFTAIKTFYILFVGLCGLFITMIVGNETISGDSAGRILGAIVGAILGGFYFTLISYKYTIKGEDKYNKKYNICKGGENYKCQIDDYNKIEEDVKKKIVNESKEVKKEKTILEDIWKYTCNTCDRL